MKTALIVLGSSFVTVACGLLACSSSSSPAASGDDGGAEVGADAPAEAAHEAGPPSPFAGTWSCQVSFELDFTTPITQKVTGSDTQTVIVTDNGDGTITASAQSIADASAPCTLKYSVSGSTATLMPGQTCMVSNQGAMLAYAYQMGTSTLTDAGASTNLAYMFSGTEQQTTIDGGMNNIMVGGTGKDFDTCSKQ
jgi:hypothetical protein